MNQSLHEFQNHMFDIVSIVLYILYVGILLGVSTRAPQYLETVQYYLKVYISLFLVIRFNGLRDIQFTELDRKIAFTAGIFLLSSTVLTRVISYFRKEEK